MIPTKVNYYPFFDIATFSLALTTLAVVYSVTSINLLVALGLALFAYLITIAKSWIIKLDFERLNIISLIPFFRSHSIDIKSIIKINSSESFGYDTVVTAEAYTVYNRDYEIEYLDKKGKKKLVSFSINNKNKEQKIIGALKAFANNQKT